MNQLEKFLLVINEMKVKYEKWIDEDETVVSFENDDATCSFIFSNFDGSLLRTELHANFYCD